LSLSFQQYIAYEQLHLELGRGCRDFFINSSLDEDEDDEEEEEGKGVSEDACCVEDGTDNLTTLLRFKLCLICPEQIQFKILLFCLESLLVIRHPMFMCSFVTTSTISFSFSNCKTATSDGFLSSA
jgi:hypothetical protein